VCWKAKLEFLEREIKHVRVVRCYSKQHRKLEVNIMPNSLSDAIWMQIKKYIIEHCKGVAKLGQAPKGNLERRIQEMIDILDTDQ
jgi:hypothetical protein